MSFGNLAIPDEEKNKLSPPKKRLSANNLNLKKINEENSQINSTKNFNNINNMQNTNTELKQENNINNNNTNNKTRNNLRDKYSNNTYVYKNPFSKFSSSPKNNNIPKEINDFTLDLKKVNSYENKESNDFTRENIDIKDFNSFRNQKNYINQSINIDEKIKNILNKHKVNMKNSSKTIIENEIIIEEDPNNNENNEDENIK